MEISENQKIIIVNKEPCDKTHLYSTINLQALEFAMMDLKTTDFKLWIYLAKNQNQYTFSLSRVDFCRIANCSKPTYLNAVKTLISKGYLVKKEDSSSIYIFYEKPSAETAPKTEDDLNIEIPREKVEESFVFRAEDW